MRSLIFEGNTWAEYEKLRENHKKLHQSLRKVIEDMLRASDPSTGIGKPEALKYNLSGFWSRRISLKDRVIYQYDDHSIYIFAIGGHYDSGST